MLSISLSDMNLVEELSNLSEFEMVSIDNEDLMQKYLYKIGMDCYDYPFVYTANYHRNLQDEVVLGYRVTGEIRCDATYKNSYLAGISERLVITAYNDPSLMEEIAELAYKVRDFSEYLNDSDSIDFDEDRAVLPFDQMEPDWEMREAKVKELQDILESIRGPVYNSAGALKSSEEYKQWFAEKGDDESK